MAEVAGIDLQIAGYILLVVGVLGLLIRLWITVGRRRAAQPSPLPPPRY